MFHLLIAFRDCLIGIAIDHGEVTQKDMDKIDGTESWRTTPKAKQNA